MDFRTWACFKLSRKLMRPARARTTDYSEYERWRHDSLSGDWGAFDDARIDGRDVLDFGCGDGQLSLYLAHTKHPQRIVGVDIDSDGIDRAKAAVSNTRLAPGVEVHFIHGTSTTIPVPDQSFDTVLAFDCMEHVMSPLAILREWCRVLRPGGRCLIEWVPYKGPWGPHMESLIPIPWAHVLFGERAMFRTAAMIYDLEEFQPRHWDLDLNGHRRPNKWRAWSSFAEQGYINQLAITTLEEMVRESQLEIVRLEKRGFAGSPTRRLVGNVLMSLPYAGEYFVSSYILELERATGAARGTNSPK